ncbi:superoxide dismutase [Modestobacter sp. NPDC049651]|uniref:superoxide dismutase n=1 Tax=unclassified Modestobacter TaxID=2643866 RepID=UPI0033CD0FDB
MPEYTLPDLPYDHSALEPHISGRIMELHHDKHHATYVSGANTALEKLADARAGNSFDTVNQASKNLAFNLAGHVNHSVFWPNMTPDGAGRPDGEIAAAIDQQFGGFEAFQAHFTAVALGVQGSGWAALTWDSVGQELLVNQLYDHQSNLALGLSPILLLDMWEHAFYLDYQNVKGDYVTAWWNVVNWADVQQRFERARRATSGLVVPAL